MLLHGTVQAISEDHGGHLYGARVTFRDPLRPESTTVTTARVHRVEDLGGGMRRIVFSRGAVQFSETVTFGPRDTREEEWSALCGGNVVWTPEPARFYSHNEPRSWRGNDQATKAIVGDVVRHNGRSFPITAAVPFGDPNPSPAWQSEPAPVVVRIRADVSGLRIPVESAEGPILTEDEATRTGWEGSPELIADAGLYVDGAKLSWQPGFRIGPLGPTGYWHDAAFRFRLGQLPGTPDTALVWYEWLFERTGFRESAELDTYVLAGGEVWSWSPAQNAETTFFVYPGGGGSFGDGYVEWRTGSEHPEPPFLRISWSGRRLVEATYRLTDGGSIFTSGWTPPAVDYTGPFFNVGFVKSGRDLTARFIPQGSASLSTIHVLSGFLPVASEGGILAAGGSCKVLGFGNNLVFGEGPGTLLQRFAIFNAVATSQDVSLPSPPGALTVRNATIDVPMTSGTARRDRYTMAGGKLRLYGESDGDEIVVTWPPSLPSGGGRPPRPQPGTVNFTDGEMRAGWRDHVDVLDAAGDLDVVPGEEVEIRRERVFDVQNPPTVQVKQEGGSWQTLTAAEMLGYWTEGEVLLRQDFLETLAGPWQIRATGRLYRQAGNCRARQANEIAIAVDELEKLWIAVGTPGGGGTAIGGNLGLRTLVIGEQACHASLGPVVTSWELSQTRGAFSQEVEDLTTAGAAFPYWRTADQWRAVVGGNVMGYTAAHVDQWFPCAAGGGYTRIGWSAGAQRAVIHMGGRPGATASDFGAPNVPAVVGDGPFGQEHWAMGPAAAQFNVMSIPFNLRGTLISRIPEGSEVLEAVMPVRVEGASFSEWSFTQRFTRHRAFDAPVPTEHSSVLMQIRYFGQLWSDYERVGHTVLRNRQYPEVEQVRNAGSASFSLIGRRDADQQVHLPLTGQWAPRTAALFRSFGAGVASGGQLQSGRWRHVDCTALVREMVRTRSSAFPETSVWPSNAGVNVSASSAHLTSYLKSLEPASTLAATLNADIWTITIEQSGAYTTMASLHVGTILARLRLPSGLVRQELVPLVGRAARPT